MPTSRERSLRMESTCSRKLLSLWIYCSTAENRSLVLVVCAHGRHFRLTETPISSKQLPWLQMKSQEIAVCSWHLVIVYCPAPGSPSSTRRSQMLPTRRLMKEILGRSQHASVLLQLVGTQQATLPDSADTLIDLHDQPRDTSSTSSWSQHTRHIQPSLMSACFIPLADSMGDLH